MRDRGVGFNASWVIFTWRPPLRLQVVKILSLGSQNHYSWHTTPNFTENCGATLKSGKKLWSGAKKTEIRATEKLRISAPPSIRHCDVTAQEFAQRLIWMHYILHL